MMVATSERGAYYNSPPQQDGRKPLWNEGKAPWQFLDLLKSPEWNYEGIDAGDESPVLVIPGFLESDFVHTVPLRVWTEGLDYPSYSSGISLFLTPNIHLRTVTETASEIFEREGRRINIVGHSMGGVLARKLARNNLKIFRSITTLSTPFTRFERERSIEGIEQLNIYTKDDGVLDWHSCVADDPNVQDYEVPGTHAGILWNPQAYRIIGSFLAEVSRQEEAELRKKILPFRASVKPEA